MRTRSKLIRDALAMQMPSKQFMSNNIDVYHVVTMFAASERVLRELMPDYLDKFHLVLANHNEVAVAFLDAHTHDSYRGAGPSDISADLRNHVARNLESLKLPRDADHVLLFCVGSDCLLLYRKKLLAFIHDHMGWPLRTVPSKVAKMLVTCLPGQQASVRRNYALAVSCFELSVALMTTCRDVCEECGAVAADHKMCGRCCKVSYCSTHCQKEHWTKKHKSVCKFLGNIQQEPVSPNRDPSVLWSATGWDADLCARYLDACGL